MSTSATTAATAAATSISNGDKLIRVAIIGAGASGLAAARVFSRSGIVEPLILEQNAYSGGVWKYQGNNTDRPTENDATAGATTGSSSSSPSKKFKKKTSPMYRGLRTNLPKEIMAFREFPFPPPSSSSSSSYNPSFVTHETVWEYLQSYQRHFDLTKYIHYSSTVQRLDIATTSNGDTIKSV